MYVATCASARGERVAMGAPSRIVPPVRVRVGAVSTWLSVAGAGGWCRGGDVALVTAARNEAPFGTTHPMAHGCGGRGRMNRVRHATSDLLKSRWSAPWSCQHFPSMRAVSY